MDNAIGTIAGLMVVSFVIRFVIIPLAPWIISKIHHD